MTERTEHRVSQRAFVPGTRIATAVDEESRDGRRVDAQLADPVGAGLVVPAAGRRRVIGGLVQPQSDPRQRPAHRPRPHRLAERHPGQRAGLGLAVAVVDRDADLVAPALDDLRVQRLAGRDRVREDADGFLWFEGRADDTIISAGYRIGPFEVESALVSHPAVAEAAAVSAPDDERGQVVRAVVVLRDGQTGSPALARELQKHVKALTAPYKYPRIVDFAAELPKTPSGKIKRAELRG